MSMRVTMLQTRKGEAGATLTAGSTYTVSDALGAELVGNRFATDTDGVLTVGARGPQPVAYNPVTGALTAEGADLPPVSDAQVLTAVSNAPSLAVGNFGRRVDVTKTQTGFAAVPATDAGDAVRANLQAALDYVATNRGSVLTLPTGFQPKGALTIKADTAVEGIYGQGFGYSTLAPQGDYSVLRSKAAETGVISDHTTRTRVRDISINPNALHNGASYAIDIYCHFLSVWQDISILPAGSSTIVYRGMRVAASDSQKFYNLQFMSCKGQPFAIGQYATNLVFYGCNFEADPNNSSTIWSVINAYDNLGRGFAAAFTRSLVINFFGCQFERTSGLFVDAGFVSFDGLQFTGGAVVFGSRSMSCAVKNAVNGDKPIVVWGLPFTFENVEANNARIRGRVDLGDNVDSVHAKHANDPYDSTFLPGYGVEWLLMPEVFVATRTAITPASGANAGIANAFAAEAAGISFRSAAATVLEASRTRDLRAPPGTISPGLPDRDGFNCPALLASADARLVLVPIATQGTTGIQPYVWRNLAPNGRLAGYTAASTTPPTGWANAGSSLITFNNTGVAGFVTMSSAAGGAEISQDLAVRPGHTYMAMARVKAGSRLTLSLGGRAYIGNDGRRHTYCDSLTGVIETPYADDSVLLQCFYTVTGRTEGAKVSLGSTQQLLGPGTDEVAWIAVVDLTEPGRLWSYGPPVTGVFAAGQVVKALDVVPGGPTEYTCLTSGAASVANFRGSNFAAPAVGATANRPVLIDPTIAAPTSMAASFTGAVSGTTLTVSAVASGQIFIGQVISGGSVPAGAYVAEMITGAGGTGTYKLSASVTQANTTLAGAGLGVQHRGTQYLDTTLAAAGKPITWSGTAWVDATGAAV